MSDNIQAIRDLQTKYFEGNLSTEQFVRGLVQLTKVNTDLAELLTHYNKLYKEV